MKAWELARKITDEAVPKLLSEQEQTWEANIDVGEENDAHLKLLWNSHVPGSYAPESIMLAAVQAKENMGYIVEGGVELVREGQKALEKQDMVALNEISAELWHRVNYAPKDEKSPYWGYKQYENWQQYAQDAPLEKKALPVNRETLEQKIYAGWVAQIVGGAVGTMIEGYTTDAIEKKFGKVESYLRKPNTYNDDITYELAFLYTYEKMGKKITSAQVAKAWAGYVPAGWSAEEMALRNIKWGVMPPESGRLGNPFGEWIGAQMRGAICGMLAPGNPCEAARLAWIDGEVSHFGNGILGEIFNAMLVSLSFAKTDVREIVDACVEMLPPQSEYYSVVKFALNACRQAEDWKTAWRKCEKKYEKYNWIHAYPNAAAEVVALWFGEGDFDKTTHIIAMAGQDVDCNAAQILTVIGIIKGMDGIDAKWKEPIGDELVTYLRRPRKISIKALAKQTADAIVWRPCVILQ